LSNLFR